MGYARNMVTFLYGLGYSKHSEVTCSTFNVIKFSFREPSTKGMRYKGLLCFDPETKIWEMKSNSPIKIEGNQKVINGKLWRKYFIGKHIF